MVCVGKQYMPEGCSRVSFHPSMAVCWQTTRTASIDKWSLMPPVTEQMPPAKALNQSWFDR